MSNLPPRLLRTWVLGMAIALPAGGCDVSGAGGGAAPDEVGNGTGESGAADSAAGSGAGDPLPEYQANAGNETLDANIIAIADATERSHGCLGQTSRPDEADVLAVLKQEYVADPSLAPTFGGYLADNVELEQARADEICDTTPDSASEELLGLVGRLTDAANRSATCRGDEGDVQDVDSMRLIEGEYLGQPAFAFESMTDFAAALVEAAEQAVESECSP